MVLRTIPPLYDTRDWIQNHTYASAQVKLLLIIHIDRDEAIFSGLHELIAFHIIVEVQVLILLIVIIITQEGISPLNVFSFSFEVLQLLLLCLDSGLEGHYLRAKASDGVVLLGTLPAECLALMGKDPDGVGLLRHVGVSLVGVVAGVVQLLLGLVEHEVQMLHVMPQLGVGWQVHGSSNGVMPCKVSKTFPLDRHHVLPA